MKNKYVKKKKSLPLKNQERGRKNTNNYASKYFCLIITAFCTENVWLINFFATQRFRSV